MFFLFWSGGSWEGVGVLVGPLSGVTSKHHSIRDPLTKLTGSLGRPTVTSFRPLPFVDFSL